MTLAQNPSFDLDDELDASAMSGDFSFDEDSLLPSKTSWHGSYADQYYQHVAHGDEASSTTYSKSPSSDSKITVSRALLVSERGVPSVQRQSAPLISSSRPDQGRAPSRTLSRTWSSLRKSTKLAWPESATQPTAGAGDAPTLSSDRPKPAVATTAPGIPKNKVGPSRLAKPGFEPSEGAKKNFVLRRKSTKSSLGSMLGFNGSDSPPPAPSPTRRPATPSVRKSFSSLSLPSTAGRDQASPELPAQWKTLRANRYRRSGLRINEKKDELWTMFKTLENEFQKFLSKPNTAKANIVRTSLLPFLQSHADHPSNSHLRPEDLDRRATILDKWWSAMLDMVNARAGQSVSGTDRPVLLDAISAIMDRPEWRCSMAPVDGIGSDAQVDSAGTAPSGDSGFFLESVLHNVRNLFVKNLFNQVVMAVDRMSLRHAPASLVSFCAKSCAYAFFYCQGIADILVRLWDVPASAIKRVVSRSSAAVEPQLQEISSEVCVAFPRPVHGLAFQSYRETVAGLKKKPLMPLGVEKVHWHGHWLSRWTGRDSDLFFLFAKHYYSLASEFLPIDATAAERLCTPGYVLVQAQMLVNLDSTIHRSSKSASVESSLANNSTFDDLLATDIPAAGLPGATLNASRLMAENRLIMLMRGVLAPGDGANQLVSRLFADSITETIQSCVQSTSIYNHNACFILCDFLQEAFVMLIQYEKGNAPGSDIVAWPFWLSVYRSMLQSQNTMTEIRLYAFLYSCWSFIAADETRKSTLCLDLLLSEEHFGRTFYHWCPMVRAYYMRLVCWRIARFDGDASEMEM